jgi:sodium transport system permease protein
MRTIFTIFKKEMTDTLRDRRTVITMVLVPFLLIPLIFTITTLVSNSQTETARDKQLKIAVYSNDNGAELLKRLKRRKDMEVLENVHPKDFKQLTRSDSLDFAVLIDEEFDKAIENGATGEVNIYYKSISDTILYERLASTITSYQNNVLQQRLTALGATMETIKPITVRNVNVYTSKESIGKLAGGFLPYFFVLFCFMGAMYPAIDLFTGEKERSTIETLLVVPANRLQILVGKMLVVVCTGVSSGLITILGLFAALKFNTEIPAFISGIAMQLLNPKALTLIIAMMIPMTTFFAGLLIPISIYARSFKEAQSLIQPMVFVVIIPLVIGFIPGTNFNFVTALVPILNVALATREIVAGTIDFGLLIVTFFSLFFFAGLGIYVSLRWFGYEGNIFRV